VSRHDYDTSRQLPDGADGAYRQAVHAAAQGDHGTAISLCLHTISLRPKFLDAWMLLGSEYAESGETRQAIDCFQHCVAQSPPRAVLHLLLGTALSEADRHEEALEQFQIAATLEPSNDQPPTRLGMELIHFLRMSEAEALLLQALAINPNNALACNNLGRVCKFQGRSAEAAGYFRRALELEPDNRVVANNLLLCLHYLADAAPKAVADEHRQLCQRIYGNHAKHTQFLASPGHPIRIGYVSGDFHTHSVAYFIEPILLQHHTDRYKIFCYSCGAVNDETTARLKSCDVTWRDIAAVSDQTAADSVRHDGIHILVDLSGHSSGNRLGLFSLRPAPIQASWIGYPGSTGLSQMDYFISDRHCDPVGRSEQLFSETVIRLPRVFSCYLPPVRFPTVSPPPHERTGVITFGSFNHLAKLNDTVIALWAELLRAVEHSRLFLKSMALGDPATRKRLLDTFALYGVAPERIALLHTVSSTEEHLELYGQVDIALDTFPYNGTTTTCEALWMGVPVVTLAGDSHAGRVGVSLLSSVGLSDLVTESAREYIAIAAGLARDHQRLTQLREQLRSMMATSPLMDAIGVTSELESAFETMCAPAHSPEKPVACTHEAESGALQHQIEQTQTLFNDDRFEEAEPLLSSIVAQEPDNAPSRLMLASTLQALGKPAEALHHFRFLLRFHAGDLSAVGRSGAMAYCLAATAAYEVGREEYAQELCSQALIMAPDLFIARFRRCLYSLKFCTSPDELENSRRRFATELNDMVQADLDEGDQLEQVLAAIGEMSPFYLAYQGEDDRNLLEIYGRWLCSVMARRYPWIQSHSRAVRPASAKIRVGFVSAHFHNHSVWKIIASGWLEGLDRSRFEICCYYAGSKNDHATARARELSRDFVQTTSIDDLVQAIDRDALDVLIYPGIGMDPYAQQLAALRLAPVQCASWGHPVTTGMPTIDYFLSSDLMEPPDAGRYYSETLVRLPNLSVSYPQLQPVLEENPEFLSATAGGQTLYLCCQNLYKYLPQHDDIFPEIASKVPGARFVFINSHAIVKERFMLRMTTVFERFGLSAQEHIVILPMMSTPRYNFVNSRIHVYLDNLEWSGGNTTLESLPFNKPVVTMPGRFMRGRHTTAIMKMMGIADTVARDREEFVDLAVRLAREPVFYREMAEKIRTRKTNVYNDKRCIAALEQFLQEQSDRIRREMNR